MFWLATNPCLAAGKIALDRRRSPITLWRMNRALLAFLLAAAFLVPDGRLFRPAWAQAELGPQGSFTQIQFIQIQLIQIQLIQIQEGKKPAAPAPRDAAPAARGVSEENRLTVLFERLKVAANADVARAVAAQIERHFEHSGSDTADLLLKRAAEAIAAKDLDGAIDLLDFVVTLRPDWAEAYHRRAIVHFILKDNDAAMRDIRAALAREPRHFHALSGLAGLLRSMGNQKGAFRAYQSTFELYPLLPDLAETIEKLRVEVEGKPI